MILGHPNTQNVHLDWLGTFFLHQCMLATAVFLLKVIFWWLIIASDDEESGLFHGKLNFSIQLIFLFYFWTYTHWVKKSFCSGVPFTTFFSQILLQSAHEWQNCLIIVRLFCCIRSGLCKTHVLCLLLRWLIFVLLRAKSCISQYRDKVLYLH